jgi:co-chaperonin GroES (HSP10)
MKPLKDLIVIEMQTEQKEKKTATGFLIQPPRWAKPQNVGKILDKGPEVSTVDVGQDVLINPYACIDTEEKTIKLIREKDILCLIEPEK